jgi:anhydro-N-acetylmuramic acid kinase
VSAVARSGADALVRFAPAAPRVTWLAGGGARNAALVAALARALDGALDCPVVSSADAGVDPDAREAVAFALLAVRRVLGTSPLGKRAG